MLHTLNFHIGEFSTDPEKIQAETVEPFKDCSDPELGFGTAMHSSILK